MTITITPAPGITVSEDSSREDHLQLFATETYNRRNLEPGQEYFRVDHHVDGRLIGTFAGIIEGNTFWSGYRSPFCGPDLIRGRETPVNVQGLIDQTLAALGDRGIKRIKVTARPTSYSRNEAYVQHALLRRGLQVTASELSYGIDLSGFATRDDYRGSLKRAGRRALRYADDEAYEYRLTQDTSEFRVAYEVIRANRAAKGNPLRLSADYLLDLQSDFGERIRFFVLTHEDLPVATALLYRLRPDIELVEYWGDHHQLDRSPMNRLAEEVCGLAIEEGIRLVDLGISSVDGEPNEGLIQFKQSIGATGELRLEMEGAL